MGSTGEVITYRQLDEGSNRFAHFLRQIPFGPDDVVAILMDNHPRYPRSLGCARAGHYITRSTPI